MPGLKTYTYQLLYKIFRTTNPDFDEINCVSTPQSVEERERKLIELMREYDSHIYYFEGANNFEKLNSHQTFAWSNPNFDPEHFESLSLREKKVLFGQLPP